MVVGTCFFSLMFKIQFCSFLGEKEQEIKSEQKAKGHNYGLQCNTEFYCTEKARNMS